NPIPSYRPDTPPPAVRGKITVKMTHIFWVTGLSPPHEKTNMRAFLSGLMGRAWPYLHDL
ncbi:hypothetical protein ACEUBD_20945, partial [Aeromonas veronii]